MAVDARGEPILGLRTREITSGAFDGCLDLTLTRTLPDGRDVQIGLLYTQELVSGHLHERRGRFRGFDITIYDQEGNYQERVLYEDGKASSLKSATESFHEFADIKIGDTAPKLSKLLPDFFNLNTPFDLKSSLHHSH